MWVKLSNNIVASAIMPNDPLEVPIAPITRARAKKLKEALNELVQNIWSKMDLEELGTFKGLGHPLIHLFQVQEEPNLCGTRGCCVRPHTSLVRLIFLNATSDTIQASQIQILM